MKSKNGNETSIKCVYTNVDCITNKIDEIELYLKSNDIDVAAITETLPKNTYQDIEVIKASIIIPGYTCEPNHLGRGICLFVKDHIQINRYPELEKMFNPSIISKLTISDNSSVTMCLMYRSPGTQEEDNNKLIKQIESVCNKFQNQNLIILGDFNYPEINWSSEASEKDDNHKATNFLNCTHSNYLIQMIDKPTHYKPLQKPSLIDLILTRDSALIENIKFNPPFGKSHHLVLDFSIGLATDNNTTAGNDAKFIIDKGDYEQMRRHMREQQWDSILPDDHCTEQLYTSFSDVLNEAKVRFIPKKVFKQNKPKLKRTFIPPPGVLEKVRLKRRLFKYYKKFPTTQNFNLYDAARIIVSIAVKRAKCTKEINIAKDIKKNPKAFFRYVTTKTKPRVNVSNLRKEDGSLTDSDKQKCDILNDFFISVFTDEDLSHMPEFEKKTNSVLTDIHVTEEDIKKALSSLNISKSPGPDQIHPRILKELANEISYPLLKIFKKSMTEGKLPSSWKLAEVRPIFKKGDKSAPGNYRPVSLTSVLCKIFEGFVRDALYKHLSNNNLLSKDQFGFCSGRSCTSQLLVTLQHWFECLDEDIPVDAAYLDFQKAFDSVPHKRLLLKLRGYGIQGNVLNWVADFLRDREQYVSINGKTSSKLPVTSGVPQGSVLGPTLFIYFINDLPDIITKVDTKIFADDTKVYTKIETENDHKILQDSIQDMFKWTEKWLIKFNSNKCKMLHLGNNNPHHDYVIGNNNSEIMETVCEKDLGVYVDGLLNFNEHISETIKKGRRMSGLIMRTMSYKSKEIMVPLFKTLIRPIIEYANATWSPYIRKNIDSLESIQRNFTKYINGMYNLSYQQRLVALNLHSLEYRRIRGDMIETFKITHNFYDPRTTGTLLKYVSVDNQTRGHKYKLTKSRTNTKQYKHFFTNRIINLWNSLPNKVVEAKTMNTFKNRIDTHLKLYMFSTNLDIFWLK